MDTELSRRTALQLSGALVGGLAGAAATRGATRRAADLVADDGSEPTYEQALGWWDAQRQVWTPIGWKGHLFRFDVFYNGTTVCQPAIALPPSDAATLKPYLTPYRGQDFQLTPVMPDGGRIPAPATSPVYLHSTDFGVGVQGWRTDKHTPVLWTEWRRQDGLVLRQSMFAAMRGRGTVQTGFEPLYAWLRYSVEYADEPEPAAFEFVLRLSKAFLKHYVAPPQQQEAFITMQVTPSAMPLGTDLSIEPVFNPGPDPLPARVFDAQGRVRLAVSVPGATSLTKVTVPGGHAYDLKVAIPVRRGAYVDVLLPMLPLDRTTFDQELALGYDGALASVETFWAAPPPNTAAAITTPEPAVNEFFRRSVQLAEVIAERSPDSGKFTFLTGSYGYDLLWSTPTSMVSHMFLDLLGRHDVVARHIDLYVDAQGKRQPPGDAYASIDKTGFFSTPLSLQSFDWLGDHGAILEAAARHALLSRDAAFIARWTDPIVKACDFIKRACASTNHDGVKGLLPPGPSNDTGVGQQSIWIQVWSYKGLVSAVELLRRIGHARAAEFAMLASNFRTTFVGALRSAAASAPTWTAPDGSKHPVLPSKFSGPASAWPHLEAFDTGALTSVWAGLLPADDPLMSSFLEYFRVGPNTKLFDRAHHNALDRVALDHEQSSAEPCYSWNLFHNWQRGNRTRYLECMYGLLTGAVSPDTFISGEHRHGMYGTLFAQPLITWAARHAVIDDAIVAGELHLLRMCPLAWLSSERETVFLRMPTLYGPVSLRFRLSTDGRTLAATHSTSWAAPPNRIVVHKPPLPGLEEVVVNG
jgi:hypothetical protein